MYTISEDQLAMTVIFDDGAGCLFDRLDDSDFFVLAEVNGSGIWYGQTMDEVVDRNRKRHSSRGALELVASAPSLSGV